jgi:hypothetical protein
MFRIDNATASRTLPPTTPIVTEPPTPGAGDGGRYFTDAIVAGGSKTLIQSEWLNMIQEELCQVVTPYATLSKTSFRQVADAIRIITEADAAGGGPGAGIGSSIPEPPADGNYHLRNREPGEADGYWTRAIDDVEQDGLIYNRSVPTGQTPLPPDRPYGAWQVSGGSSVITDEKVAEGFIVRKTGDDATGLGTAARPWRTIQHAVDVVTKNYDANGKIVRILVGPHKEPLRPDPEDQKPWEGFEVLRPLQGAPLDGFKIIGNVASSDSCELGQIRRPPIDPADPDIVERYSVYAHNAKIAISGFTFIAEQLRNRFVCADGNQAVIALEGGIIFWPMTPEDNLPSDWTISTFCHLAGLRGGTFLIRAPYNVRTTQAFRELRTPSTCQSEFYLHCGGKVLFNPHVNCGLSNFVGCQHGSNVFQIRINSIVDLTFDSGFIGQKISSLTTLGRAGIVSGGNAYQGPTPGTFLTTGMRNVAGALSGWVGANPNGSGVAADRRTYWSHFSSTHSYPESAGTPNNGVVGYNPDGGGPNFPWP